MRVLDWSVSGAAVAVMTLTMLGGCSTSSGPPQEVYREVKVTVPVSCVPATLKPAPNDLLTAAQLAAIPDGPSRYVAMAEDWLLRVARMNDTEPVVKSCRQAGPAP